VLKIGRIGTSWVLLFVDTTKRRKPLDGHHNSWSQFFMANLGSQEIKWLRRSECVNEKRASTCQRNSTQRSFLHSDIFFNSTHSTVNREFNVYVARLGLSQSMRRHVSLQFEGLRKDVCISHFMSNVLLFHNYVSQVVLYLNGQLRTRLTQDRWIYCYSGPQMS